MSSDTTADTEWFSADITSARTTTCIRLHGELDLASARVLAEQLQAAAVRGAHTVLLDANDLTFCDAGGLQLLLAVAARCATDGQQMRLFGVHGIVARLLDVTDTAAALNNTGADHASETAVDLGRAALDGDHSVVTRPRRPNQLQDAVDLWRSAAEIRIRSAELRLVAQQLRGQAAANRAPAYRNFIPVHPDVDGHSAR